MATQLTTTSGLSATMQSYYDRKMLEYAKTQFVFANYAQKRSIPKNNGKTVQFRRWTLFTADPDTQALTEGTTPAAQNLSMSAITATVKQYGAYVEVSDLLDLTAIDNIISDSSELLGEQLGNVLDMIVRDAMSATTNIQYADGKTSDNDITAAQKLTVGEIRKAVRTLKKAKARKFTRKGGKPHYICIVDPDAVYDLQSDSLWQDVSKYSCAEQIYSGEIGRLFGVVFVESTEAKVFSQSVLNKVKTATSSSKTFVLKNSPKDAEAAYLSTAGNKIKIGTAEYTVASFDAATNTVTLSDNATLTADAIVYSEDAGSIDGTTKAGADVHSTLIFGKDAYGIVDVGGSGALQIIIKPHGSAGTSDPLDQRATVGAKVAAYAAKILNELWIIRIEHGVSA